MYDRWSINTYFYLISFSDIRVYICFTVSFFTLHVSIFIFCCISCCTTLGPSISCSCVECLPLRLSDQIRTDDHMMIKWQYMMIFIWTCRIMVIMFIWQYDHQQPATLGLRPNTDWWSYMMISIGTALWSWQYDDLYMSLQDDDYHDQQPATRGIRPNTVWWSYDDQYRDPLHWEHDNMIIFIRTCRILIITFSVSLYDNMMINKWPYSLVIIIWWSTYDTIMIAEIRPPSATTKIWQLGGRRENMMDQRERAG